MAVNFKNITIAFAVVAVLLAAAGGVYFVSSGGLERGHLYYHGNGGVDGENDVDCTYDHIVWGVGFQKDFYILETWNTKADGTGDSYKVGTYITYEKDIHLYAQWVSILEYNCVYVASYTGDTLLAPDMTLHTGSDSTAVDKSTYVLTRSSDAYITLDSSSVEWNYHLYSNINLFMVDGTDDYGYYYCVMIYVDNATNLAINEGKMCMDIGDDTCLRIVAVVGEE